MVVSGCWVGLWFSQTHVLCDTLETFKIAFGHLACCGNNYYNYFMPLSCLASISQQDFISTGKSWMKNILFPGRCGQDEEEHLEVHRGLPAAFGWQHHWDQGLWAVPDEEDQGGWQGWKFGRQDQHQPRKGQDPCDCWVSFLQALPQVFGQEVLEVPAVSLAHDDVSSWKFQRIEKPHFKTTVRSCASQHISFHSSLESNAANEGF